MDDVTMKAIAKEERSAKQKVKVWHDPHHICIIAESNCMVINCMGSPGVKDVEKQSGVGTHR